MLFWGMNKAIEGDLWQRIHNGSSKLWLPAITLFFFSLFGTCILFMGINQIIHCCRVSTFSAVCEPRGANCQMRVRKAKRRLRSRGLPPSPMYCIFFPLSVRVCRKGCEKKKAARLCLEFLRAYEYTTTPFGHHAIFRGHGTGGPGRFQARAHLLWRESFQLQPQDTTP